MAIGMGRNRGSKLRPLRADYRRDAYGTEGLGGEAPGITHMFSTTRLRFGSD